MLTRATAHGGCTDITGEPALGADSRGKIPCRTWDSNPCQYCAWLFSQTLCKPSYSKPWRQKGGGGKEEDEEEEEE